LLNARIEANNKAHGLNMKLITGNADGLNRLGKLALKGVNNYIILAGKDTPDLDEKLGMPVRMWLYMLKR